MATTGDCQYHLNGFGLKSTPIPTYIDDEHICLYYTAAKNRAWADHCHDKHQIIIIPEPRSRCEISWVTREGARKGAILGGQCIIYIERQTVHAFRTGDEGVFISIGVSDDEARRATLGNLWTGVRVSPWWSILKHDTLAWHTIQRLRSYCYLENSLHPHDLKGHAYTLASCLLGVERIQRATTRGGLTPLQLSKVDLYIEDHFRDKLTVEDLAAVVGLKKDHFAHLFKTSTGFPPHDYVVALRLEYVRRLKNCRTMTNMQIAVEAGFYDESHLYYALKSFCRKNPGKYHGILPLAADSSNSCAE